MELPGAASVSKRPSEAVALVVPMVAPMVVGGNEVTSNGWGDDVGWIVMDC